MSSPGMSGHRYDQEVLSPSSSYSAGEGEEPMIEPMYDEDISTIINEVRPDDVQHFQNEKFIRISEKQVPEMLKFLDESDDFQFDDWAIIGEVRAEEDSPVPGSAEAPRPPPPDMTAESAEGQATNLFADSDGLEASEGNFEEAEAEAEKEDGDEVCASTTEVENSMVFSMFLSNWEEQVRQIREAKRLEWEMKMKGLLGEEENEEEKAAADFVDEDGESWVIIENPPQTDSGVSPSTELDPTQLQMVAVPDGQLAAGEQQQQQAVVARRPGFFENWPSFNIGSKLGVVLAATGTSFCFGFMMGARAAMDSFYRLCERPLVAGIVGVAATYAVAMQPTVMLTAVKYIILGGVVGGSAVATPVFVVGTTGVFVSAAVFHAWVAAKRSAIRAITSATAPKRSRVPQSLPAPTSPSSIPAKVDAPPIVVPLKKVDHDNNINKEEKQ